MKPPPDCESESVGLAPPLGRSGRVQLRFGGGKKLRLLGGDVGQPLVDVGHALAGALLFLVAAGPFQFEHGQRQVFALWIVRIADAFGHGADVLHSAAGNG